MRFVIQAAVLLFITGIPALLLLARIQAASTRHAATVAWVVVILWLASSNLAESPDDGAAPSCASAQGPYSC